jgi:AbrB family looped-hinge helix DNA binding protein
LKVRLSSKGQITLPAELRWQDNLSSGQAFEFNRIGPGEYYLKRSDRQANEGLVQLLLDCPVKGWFRPMERREWVDVKLPYK